MDNERLEMSEPSSDGNLAVLHAIGVRLDDQLEAAEAELLRCEGAVGGIAQTREKMEGLLGHVDKDVDEGKLDLEQAALAKKHVTRCLNLAEHMRTMADAQLLRARGAVAQADRAVKLIKSEYEAAKARLAANSERTSLDQRARADHDRRPGPSLKERRLAEGQTREQEDHEQPSEPDDHTPEEVDEDGENS